MLVVLVPEAGDPFNSQDSRARKSWLWRAPSSRVRQHGRKFASRQPDQWTNGWCWSRRTVWRKGLHEIFSHNMSQLSIFIVKFSYVDIHTYIYIHIYVHIYICIYVYMYIYIYIWYMALYRTHLRVTSGSEYCRGLAGLHTCLSCEKSEFATRVMWAETLKPPLVDSSGISSGIILHTRI